MAANTHSRQVLANLTLGDGQAFPGEVLSFWRYTTVSEHPLVLADGVGLPGVDATKLAQCRNGTLDASKVTVKTLPASNPSLSSAMSGEQTRQHSTLILHLLVCC